MDIKIGVRVGKNTNIINTKIIKNCGEVFTEPTGLFSNFEFQD